MKISSPLQIVTKVFNQLTSAMLIVKQNINKSQPRNYYMNNVYILILHEPLKYTLTRVTN